MILVNCCQVGCILTISVFNANSRDAPPIGGLSCSSRPARSSIASANLKLQSDRPLKYTGDSEVPKTSALSFAKKIYYII